jgi:hypothetical protein
MLLVFCCSNAQGYKNCSLSHEDKFRTFMSWAAYPKESSTGSTDALRDALTVTLAIQVVRQVNYGPLESKRYFVHTGDAFVKVTEQWLVSANF